MGYVLGIDLGTSRTAAAVQRNGRVDLVPLSDHAAAMPSMVFVRDGEPPLIGEAARRRGRQEPARLAREFKRRFGDDTPLWLGGAPYTAEQLTALVLRHVVDFVAEREGGPPDRVVVAHPANWGEYRRDLLRDAVARAGLADAILVTEPQAAAVHHAASERMAPGEIIAVYDLGGGTFDAALLRRTANGFEPAGEPKGVERLGGIDFDEIVFAFVATESGLDIEALTERDVPALLRLRDDCQSAKEVLSDDRETAVVVAVGGIDTTVRITREQFEARIRPSIRTTVDCVRTAIVDAGLQPDQVSSILMVGGSSRIPMAAEMVRAELGRPVVFTSNPKAAVALGAALLGTVAAGTASTGTAATGTVAAALLAPPTPVSASSVQAAPVSAAPPSRTGPPPPGGFTPSATTQPGSDRQRWWVALAAVSAVVIAAVAFLALRSDSSGGTGSATTPEATRAGRVSTTTDAVTTTAAAAVVTTGEASTTTAAPVVTTAPATTVPPTQAAVVTTVPRRPPPPEVPALYAPVPAVDRNSLPDALVPPADQSAPLPDGVYFATVDFQPGTGAIRASITPYFKGPACEQAAAADGDECLNDTYFRFEPFYEVLVLDDVPVTLNVGDPDVNRQLSIDELRQLIATDGTPTAGAGAPQGFFFTNLFFVTVVNGEPTRLDGFFNP